MIDHTQIKLGKHPARKDDRTLRMAKYLTATLPPAPSIVDWTPPALSASEAWQMMGNDTYGDCTFAGIAHGLQVWTGNNGDVVTLTTQQVVSSYLAFTGGRDEGANELDVLNMMTQTGLEGHKIQAYASIESGGSQLDLPTFEQTIYLCGFSYIGIQLPSAWQGKNLWDVYGPLSNTQNQPGSWGGHAVIVVAYIDASGKLQFSVVTWGGIIPMTSQAAEVYIDEAYGLLSAEWLASGNVAPNVLEMTSLTADLQAVKAA